MKRSPMKRSSRLKRSGMKRTGTKSKKRKSPKRKTKYAQRERDFDYMEFVKTLPCRLAGLEGAGPCSGVTEADHAGLDAGLTQKAPDDTCIPMCTGHHRDRHACTGFFRGREKGWKRNWRLCAIAETQAEYANRPRTIERID